MSPDAVRANLERVRAEVGPDVTIVAATKYVAFEQMAALAEAGVEVVGENRAQDLERKHAAYGDAFAGTSSATSSRTRPRSWTLSASSSIRSPPSRPRGG